MPVPSRRQNPSAPPLRMPTIDFLAGDRGKILVNREVDGVIQLVNAPIREAKMRSAGVLASEKQIVAKDRKRSGWRRLAIGNVVAELRMRGVDWIADIVRCLG